MGFYMANIIKKILEEINSENYVITPPLKVRKFYTENYIKFYKKTKHDVNKATKMAYDMVEKKSGRKTLDDLKAYHKYNEEN